MVTIAVLYFLFCCYLEIKKLYECVFVWMVFLILAHAAELGEESKFFPNTKFLFTLMHGNCRKNVIFFQFVILGWEYLSLHSLIRLLNADK